jgi:hypothetical protein
MINQRWSLDFIMDTLSDGRRYRILCIVDDFSRECLAAWSIHHSAECESYGNWNGW